MEIKSKLRSFFFFIFQIKIDTGNIIALLIKRGFRLPQRSHLQTLKIFVSEKSGKRCEQSGKHWIKSGNREIWEGYFSCIHAWMEIFFIDKVFAEFLTYYYFELYQIYNILAKFII